jgi:hypothetical protein
MEEHKKIALHMTPEVKERLEERRILIDDVQRVIHYAENSGDVLVHPATGHRKASFKPYQVTFWVDYTKNEDGGYIVHNACAHRMSVF